MPAPRSEALLGGLEHFGMRLGLERVRRLLGALGDPHLSVPSVLVAGTNGKGSTAGLLASMCRAAGYCTGLFTSPHLEAVTERLALDGKPISDRRLADYLRRGLDLATDLECEPPTFFEALAIAAFSYFRDAGADLAIMEVGLGGRLDATNAAEPVLSLITSIGHDHETHLGDTLAAIAGEKCGILRRGRPAIARAGDREVEQVLQDRAREIGADLLFADRQAVSASTPPLSCLQRARLETTRGAYEMDLHLAGRHQLDNLAVAVLAAEALATGGWPALDRGAICSGVENCRWPGRLEWIDLGGGRRVLLDAAHNAAGIEALLGYLDHLDERPDLLFGAFAEKSIDGVLPRLDAATGGVVLTRTPGERSASPERWRPFFARPALEPDLDEALARALADGDRVLLVCGSVYLVGRIREILRTGQVGLL